MKKSNANKMASYLIKCIVCSGILLVVYHFLLEREKMFRFNRFYLLGAMVFSLLAPLVTIEMPSQLAQEAVAPSPVMPPAAITAQNDSPMPVSSKKEGTNLTDYLPWLLYGFVTAGLLLRTGFQMLTMRRAGAGSRIVPFQSVKLVLTPGDMPVHSFFKYIFLPQKAFENNAIPNEILTHELAHARQMHSADILFTELLIASWWFNPLLLLYRRAIRLNHEYLADESVLAGPTDVKTYQLLLLDTLLAQRATALASSFHYPFTKKRLAMMTTAINLRIQFAKKAIVALLLPALVFALAEKTYSQQPISKPAAKPEKKVENTPVTAEVSEAEMQQFFATIEQNTRVVKNGKGRTDFHINPSPEVENELYAVYERMNDAQKAQIKAKKITLFRMDIPVKKAPTPEIFENWKRADIFGVWLNGKHVPNAALNKYKHSDIAEYDLSKLYGAALKGRSYKYQLDLTTNEHFDKTYEQRVNDRVFILRTGWYDPKEATKKGK